MKNFYTLLFALLITGLGFTQTTIFNEGGGGSEPTGWTFTNNVTSNAIDRGTYWLVDSGNPSDVITTSTYDLSTYTDGEFTLDVASFGGGGHNSAKIEISFDGGSNYTQTETSTTTTGSSYISGGTITLNSVSSQVVIRISNNGTTGRGVRLRNLELTASGTASGCTAPTTQASAYNTTSIGTTSATLNWTDGDGDEVLVLVKEGSAVDTDPTNGTSYTGNTVFTSGDQIGTGNYVVQSGSAASTVSITGLSPATTYHVAVYEYNTTGNCYELTELTGNFTTGCSTPSDVTTFTATAGNTEVDLSWTNGSCYDEILVVAKASSAVTESPTGDGTAYTANTAFGSGTDLGTSEYAVYKGTGTSVTVTGLTNGTTYHFEAFARKISTWSSGETDSASPIDQLEAGDVAFIAYNADGTDEFSFVALADIPANTTIWFTDNEWGGSSFNDLNEGEIEWSHTSIVNAGTVITIENTNNSSPIVNTGTVSGGSVNLNASNEQLFALLSEPSSSTMATPGFLAGIASDISGSTLTGSGLTDGTNFLDFGDDNDGYKYTASRSSESTFADYLPLIMNSANWQIEASEGNNILPISTTSFILASGCTTPTTQASAYNTTALGTTSATLNWTSGDGDEVLVVVKEGSAVDTDPTDGTAYTGNSVFTAGDQIGTGNYIVQSGSAASSVSITGLNPSTTYHVAVYEYNTTGTCYELNELTGNFTTDCSTPSDVTAFTATSGDTTIDLSWTNGICFDEILVVAKANSAVTNSPTGDGTAYTADVAFGSGTDLGSNEYVIYKGIGTSVTVTGLTNGTTYHFEAFARKITTWSSGVTDSATPNTVEEAIAGDLIITEVSGDGSDGNSGNDNGFMEIYNRSNKIINLNNIEARYFNSNPGNSTQQVTLSGTLSPGSYIIVTQNGTNYTTEYTDTADATGSSFFFNGGDDGCDVYHTTNGVIDQFNDNGIGQSPWDWEDNSTWNRNSTGSGAIKDNWTEDGTDNPRTKTNLYFWTGTSDNSWTNTANWDEGFAPSSTTDVVITDQTNEPIITTSVEVDNITIETSVDVVVEKTGNLEATGNLNNSGSLSLESDSNEYSSLIINGTSNGIITYDRHVNINGSGTTGSNDLISAPLTGQAFNTFASANPNILSNTGGTLFLFGPYDKVTGAYLTYSDTETATLNPGVGYRAASDDNSTFTFTGSANNTDVVINITNSGPTEAEWNLIGNPYPSYLNVQDFLNHEVSSGVSNLQLFNAGTAAVYGYDGNALDGWTIYNLANTTASTVLAPGQGFFVSADETNDDLYDLEFTPAMRSTGTTDDFIVGRNAELIFVKVNASTSAKSHSTEFYFNSNASQGFDFGYDAELWGESTSDFAIYSHLVENNQGKPIALQALNPSDLSNTTIPLGVSANQGEQLTFSIAESTLSESVNVYLDDVVANTSTLLNNGDYVITPTAALSGTGRFFLRTSEDALSTIDNNLDAINIFALNNTKELVVNGQLQENASLNLYDIQGRKVLSTRLDNSSFENRIDTSVISAGVYVVTVVNNGQQKTQKVIIK